MPTNRGALVPSAWPLLHGMAAEPHLHLASNFFFFFNFFFYYLFMIVIQRERGRDKAEIQAEGEADSMHREPDVGFDPGSPGSRPGPKAGAKPLRHPGIPGPAFLSSLKLCAI